MSLSAIKPWFRDRLEKLNFNEHPDGFNVDNIGEIDLDRAFHTLVQTIKGGPINMSDQKTESSVVLKVFFKGGRAASEEVDEAIYEIEKIVKECCNIKSRTLDGLLNVVFDRAQIEPRANDNDNSVMVTLDFTVFVLLGVEE